MGSFNASCAVSHCSINPGDEVKLVAIVSNTPIDEYFGNRTYEMHNGFACYCHDHFSIIGYPMDATYEDYGNFDVKEDMFSQYNLSIIREKHTRNVSDNTEDDEGISTVADRRNGYSIKSDDLSWEKISELVHYGNMYLDSNTDKTKRRYMGFFPIHKCVYDLLMKRTPEMYLDNHYGSISFQEFVSHVIDTDTYEEYELDEHIVKYMDMMEDLIGSKDNSGNHITPEYALLNATRLAELEIESKEARNSQHRDYSYDNTTDISRFRRHRRNQKLPVLTDEEHRALLTIDAECTFLVRGLNDLQIQIIPPMTAGQEYDKTEHAVFMVAAGKALLAVQEEDNGEEPEISVGAEIIISLKTLRDSAVNYWDTERGKLKVDAIDKFVVQYPNGATLSASDVISQGYSELLANIPRMLPLVFNNDLEVQ